MKRWCAACAAVLVLACDRSPTTPQPSPATQQPPPVQTIRFTRITVTGPQTIAPGETASYKAMGVMADGTMQDVTSQVIWRMTTSVASVQPTGSVTGTEPGEGVLIATLNGRPGSQIVIVVPSGTYRLMGTVAESGLPVAGAVVTVVEGVGAGKAAMTNNSGQYRLYGVGGNVRLQATKNEYVPSTGSVVVESHLSLNLDIRQTREQVIAGDYLLEFKAGKACNALPEDARQRRYTASVSQSGPRFTVALGGATFVVSAGLGNAFSGRVEPDRISFDLPDGYYYGLDGPAVVEALDDTRRLIFTGSGPMTRTPTGLAGNFNGTVWIESLQRSTLSRCPANDHQLVMTAR
jgi:hypothetical protein